MQGFERSTAALLVAGLICHKGMIGSISEKRGRMRITSAAIDAAVIDKEITRGIFRVNRMLRINTDI